MSRAVSRCQHCQHHIVNTFAALASLMIRTTRQSSKPFSLRPSQPATRRYISSSSRLFQTPSATPTGSNPEESTPSPTSTPQSQQQSPPPSTASSIPWYLQIETPTPPTPTISSPLSTQDIPPLPSNPPPLLHPLLIHLSTSIGLDDLHLLDLRSVHPPPALGANLIMVLGTARSYKHLNTSADRFCRWLRSMYKLRPYADGLLGRNEMKLKLRRKARRLKLAQSVGNTVMANSAADDGITTGWICVNLGSLEGVVVPEDVARDAANQEVVEMSAEDQEEMGSDEESYENPVDEVEGGGEGDGYIGFGSRSTAPKIVVQMFTEEKRLEMDLEGLWDMRRERRSQKEQKVTETARRMIEAQETGDGSSPSEENSFNPWAR